MRVNSAESLFVFSFFLSFSDGGGVVVVEQTVGG